METITTSSGVYEAHEHYIIATYNEGVDIGEEHKSEIIEILQNTMTKPFGWISDKVNSFSFDPTIVPDILAATPLIKSYCAAVHGHKVRDTGNYVDSYSQGSIAIGCFDTLDEAIEWTEKIAKSKS